MATKQQVNGAAAPAHALVHAKSDVGTKAAAASTAAAAATAGSVWVSDQFAGAAVTQVKQSGSGGSEALYWLNVSGAGTATSLEFVVTFKAGSPLTSQHQHFSFPGGYGGGTSTPFGVPLWGGNPILGPATLTVLVNGSSVGSYNFTVVA